MHPQLLEIAADLSATIAQEDRYRRLVQAVRRMVPCDAVALMSLEGDTLVPLASEGLRGEVEGRRFVPSEHPRLERILATDGPVRFTGSALPDPFDGLLAVAPATAGGAQGAGDGQVHACMGCRLRVENRVVGVVTMDALDPSAFDGVRDSDLRDLAFLAGATLQTAMLISALEESCRRSGLMVEQLRAELRERVGELVGKSEAMARLREDIELASSSPLSVLITGETGVGKELVARALHRRSERSARPLVHVNCAALPESLAESELFGHVRGAFTGAHASRAGRFEAADGGTIFLDEIGELPLSVQPKLLRVLQHGEVQRVGSDRVLHVDVRVLAATNRDLEAEVRAGRFRQDLYHRLSVYPIEVPPLRERPDDIPVLAGYLLDRTRARLGLGVTRIAPRAMDALLRHTWPGNVRELEHTLMRAALRAAGGRRREPVLVEPCHLGLSTASCRGGSDAAVTALGVEPGEQRSLAEATDDFRRRFIQAAVDRADGNWAAASRALGMNRGNLHRLAKRLGLLTPAPPTPSASRNGLRLLKR